MFKFFPIFSKFIESLTTETLRIGDLRDPADIDLLDGLSISVYRQSETEAISEQGYKAQYRLRVDFTYCISIFSRNSESQCNELATMFMEGLEPGIDIHIIDYDESDYVMQINKIQDDIEYRKDVNTWVEKLTFTGFTLEKSI